MEVVSKGGGLFMIELDRPIRVAQVIGMAVNGGTESLWINYYRHIDRTKVQFDFLIESESRLINKKEIESLGGHVIIIPSYKNPFKYMKKLKKIFKENNYDVVHSNMNALSVFTLKAAKKAGVKVRIAHSHSTSNKKEWKKNILKNILRLFSKKFATNYFACSEHAGRWLFGNKTYRKGLVTIINDAIDINRFKYNENFRIETRKKLNIDDDCMVLGNVGRFMLQKNQYFLIDIFKEYKKISSNSKLLLIGEGPLKEAIEAKAIKYGISSDVIFIEPNDKIEKYYSTMDLFLFPSLYEGLGIALIEAQTSGLNCFASLNVPIEAKVSDRVTFIQNNNLDEWMKMIKNAVSNNRSLQSIDDSYDIKKCANELEQIYYKCLE